MKAGLLAVAAAVATGASARNNFHAGQHQHKQHEVFHAARALSNGTTGADATCGCSTVYYTVTGEPTLYFPPAPATPTPEPSTSSSVAPPPTTASPTSVAAPTVPTPFVTTLPTPGVYTIPATTITITEETTVCDATSTTITPGTHTVGGITTLVPGPTTLTVPYATTTTEAGAVTSTILTTTYVCPTGGAYTIGPLTTTVSESTIWVYPTPATYPAGTYTQDAVTTTITETDFVYVCPFTSPAPIATVAPIATSVSAPPAATSSPAVGGGGKQWAITYTPYDNAGLCKDAAAVAEDIEDIASKGFSTIRVYSTDCSGLENIGNSAAANGLSMIIGVFISNTGIAGAQEQIDEIIAWGRWPLVELAVIGNEAIQAGSTTAGELAGFIVSAKTAFQGAGYTGPCTTTETLNVWQANSGVLCDAVDVVGANIHPFFNPTVLAASAGEFVANQLDIVDGLCPGKKGVNLETGWPSGGICNGVACPGVLEQSLAVLSIASHVGDRSVMFSYTDDEWKAPGEFDCERSWGAIQLFG